MEFWVEVARGPVFRGALVFMILGLLRLLCLSVWEAVATRSFRAEKGESFPPVAPATMAGAVPIGHAGQGLVLGLTIVIFRASTISVAVFLGGHVVLWEAGIGVSWPTVSNSLADILTGVAVVTALLLIVERAAMQDFRKSSTLPDYLFPLAIAVPFVSGFLVMHPAWNPFGFSATMLVHAMSADLLLVLIPLAKVRPLSMPSVPHLFLARAWQFAPKAGQSAFASEWKGNRT